MFAGEPATFEVPVVDALPDCQPPQLNTRGMADYLLTQLFRFDNAILSADFAVDGGRWRVRCRTPETSALGDVVATVEPLGAFRMLLARFGAHYMAGQVYGGYCELRLTQQGRSRGVALYMANDAWRGHWLKAYSSAGVYRPPGTADQQ
jgi:hypothetical protein